MANGVDPNQEQCDLGVHYLHIPFCQKFVVQKLRTFTIYIYIYIYIYHNANRSKNKN